MHVPAKFLQKFLKSTCMNGLQKVNENALYEKLCISFKTILHQNTFMFLFKCYFSSRSKETETERRQEDKHSHLLVHSPNFCQRRNWAAKSVS